MRTVITLSVALLGAALVMILAPQAITWGKRQYYAHEGATLDDTTARSYERLLRAQFTATDPSAAQRPILCEGERLFSILGYDSASKLLGRTARRVLATTDMRARRRVDSSPVRASWAGPSPATARGEPRPAGNGRRRTPTSLGGVWAGPLACTVGFCATDVPLPRQSRRQAPCDPHL